MSLKEIKEKYLSLLISDSYSKENANKALDKIFSDAKTAVAGCKNQLDLTAKIKNDTYSNKISPNKPVSLLLGLLEFAPFEIDIRKLMLTTMSYHSLSLCHDNNDTS
jgi:hypothetical protein